MPLAKVFYRAPFYRVLADLLGNELPAILASALTCDHPDGKLTPGDVEVDVEPMPQGMRSNYDLHIEVEANDYPDRKANLDERWVQINDAVRIFLAERLLPTDLLVRPKGWIWVRLFPAKWGEIWPK